MNFRTLLSYIKFINHSIKIKDGYITKEELA